jgi:quaternary ammonium compound-resistance protein SugE
MLEHWAPSHRELTKALSAALAISSAKVSRHFPSSSERIVMPWLWLIVGGLFEVGFTTSLRFVDGFRNLPWTLAFLASVAVSMGLLEVASRSIPMGTAYAVWGGIGAVGTVVVGILWFHEPSSAVRMLLILAIVVAIAALRLTA